MNFDFDCMWLMNGYMFFGENPFMNEDFEQLVTRVSASGTVQKKNILSVDKRNGIAQIRVNGPLMPTNGLMAQMMGGTSTNDIKQAVARVGNDKTIKGAVILGNSRGGANAGIDEAATMINEVSKIKPINTHIAGNNCSAMYYLSSASNKIFSQSKTDFHGNIGTRLVLQDRSEQFKNEGIKPVVIDTGANKSIGVPGLEITLEQQEHLQGICNELQDLFEQSILKGRPNINIADVNDGKQFLSRTAIAKGLIDGIQPVENTIAMTEIMASRK